LGDSLPVRARSLFSAACFAYFACLWATVARRRRHCFRKIVHRDLMEAMAPTPVTLRNYFYQLSDFIFLVWSFSQTIFTNKIPDEIISNNGLKSSAYKDSTPRYVTRRSFT
jgi:hypothetical protein